MRLLHFVNEDGAPTAEYVVFIEDGDSRPVEDFRRPRFNLLSDVEIDFFSHEMTVSPGLCYVLAD